MNPLISGIIAAAFAAIADANIKKALDIWNVSKLTFRYMTLLFWWLIIVSLVLVLWIDREIQYDIFSLIVIFALRIMWMLNTWLYLHIYQHSKMSEILPYNNLDKLFIILIWFIVFQWSGSPTSLSTFLISILTVIIVIFFSIDYQKFQISWVAGLMILHKALSAIFIIGLWFLLITYSSITLVFVGWLYEMILTTAIIFRVKGSIRSMFTQKKDFYITKISASFLGRSGYIMTVFILESAWVIMATLIGFTSIAFNIASIKYILHDTPSRKQILLACIVISLIGIGYYLNIQ